MVEKMRAIGPSGIGPVERRELSFRSQHKEGGAHVDADITRSFTRILWQAVLQRKDKMMSISNCDISRLVAGKQALNCLIASKKFPPLKK